MKKTTVKLVTGILFMGLFHFAFAQDDNLTPSQRRAQKKLDQQNQNVFGDDDPAFKVITIPDKWKNESAVVIAQNVEFDYYTSMGTANYDEIVRRRVMLLDKSAVDEYSTFTFLPGQEVGFRIIKKDGSVKKVSTLDAVTVQEGLPQGYHIFGMTVAQLYAFGYAGYKKLAIANLEPGDIIDYYYVYKHEYLKQEYRYGIPFPAVIFTLSEENPIMKQKVQFYVKKDFYINFSSSNGASNLRESTPPDKKTKLFEVIDQDRERKKDEIWKYDYRSEPTVKFQVVYCTSDGDKDNMPYFLGEQFVPQTTVPNMLAQGVADQIAMEKTDISTKAADEVIKYMRKYHKNEPDSVKYMEEAYYYLRFFLFVEKKNDLEDKQYVTDPMDAAFKQLIPADPTDYIWDEFFVKTMGLVARDNGIQYQLEFAVPREIGTLDNMVLRGDLSWLIRIRGPHDLLLYPPNTYTNADEPIPSMEGVNAYYIIPSDNFKKIVMDKTAIPVSPYSSNVASYKMDVNFAAQMDGSVSIGRNAKLIGLAKGGYYPDVLTRQQYEDNEYRIYGMQTGLQSIKAIHNDKKRAEAMQQYENEVADENKKRMDLMKESLKDDYSIDSYDDFNLVSSGIEKDSTTLVFNDKFKVKDLVKKVGPNYMFEVGKLIGTQLEIKGKDTVRQSDVNMAYARETDNELDITIPAGYKVDGLDALNMNFTNSTGGFVSTAKMNGNKLVITTKKYYASNMEPKNGWYDMEKFLIPAYNFSQKKVLLKKA
jgi:hypothetical protein